ncbi:unnamed protein product [Clonostachys rosea]|uniref:O-methylsterigmatocystin oxidoreductase n=1 Tax=Bionectria ochroleuca TaxID=29856 RepID=A0ABY6TQY2_BIOOC|nr:unnamed protein product [Clonostachys rosea]
MGFLQLLALISLAYPLYQYFFNTVRVKLPPGPKPWPILGNITDLPPKGIPEYQHWIKHKDTYGPISSVTVLGKSMIILHDREAVQELLEKKSLKTSSRPWLEFASRLCDFGRFTTLQPYNDTLRRHRKFMHQQLGTKTLVAQYNHTQETETGRLLLRLLDDPQNLIQHLKTEAGAVILKITYGYTIEPKAIDPLVTLIERMMVNLSATFMPLASAVDLIPPLKHLPGWFPGASFKRAAVEVKKVNDAVTDVPYDFVHRQMANHTHTPSYVSRLVEQLAGEGQRLDVSTENIIKYSAGILYAGGSDTTVSSLSSLALAMLKFPKVQHKAQNEIDNITSQNRLPYFDDRPKLPYINAVVKEILRWFPVTPLGMSHTVDEDIIFKDYLIPKGAILLPAVRWLLHDPQVYENPEVFDPSRYLPPRNEPDPALVAFGFGRRVCPGRFLADSSLFINTAQLLATFEFKKAHDDMGREIEPRVRSEAGLIDHPVEFPYRLEPRSEKHAELVRGIADSQPWEQSNANDL